MDEEPLCKDFFLGKRYLKKGDMEEAARAFERAYKEDMTNPMYLSYYGMCLALRWGKIGVALELCTKAIKKEFYKSEYYLNLAKVYLAADNKKGAITVIKKGIRFDHENDKLHDMLVLLGVRKKSIIPFLKRSNPINRFLGIVFRRTLPDLMRKKGPEKKHTEDTHH